MFGLSYRKPALSIGLGIVRRHFDDLAENVGRALGIALGQHRLAHLDQRLDLGFERLRLARDRKLGE